MTTASQSDNQPDLDIPIIDYEGSGYKTDFWVEQGREYEDATERIALRRLIPPTGKRIAEIGAGFGRLADLYLGYDQIILFDYSRTLLQDAVKQWGHDPRFVFVAGNIYELPLAAATVDTLVMVRVMHHLANVPTALQQIQRVLHSDSTAVLEYANKRNLKAMLRWAVKQQSWSPYDPEPVEFVELNFDFHPNWMDEQFERTSLQNKRQFGVSHFRLPALKKLVGTGILSKLDSALFSIGGKIPIAPSVFVQLEAPMLAKQDANIDTGDLSALFSCPTCQIATLSHSSKNKLVCSSCNSIYSQTNGIWDFKVPG